MQLFAYFILGVFVFLSSLCELIRSDGHFICEEKSSKITFASVIKFVS